MRRIFFIATILCIPVLSSASANDAARRPDIVWILAEDISIELACYGEPGLQTPNIDALAASGVRYERAYCTGPACSVSRSSMMSGVYQTRIDAHDHRRVGNSTFPAMTQFLRKAGYYSAAGCGYSAKTDLNFTPAEKLFDGKNWNSSEQRPVFAQVTLPASHRKDVAGKKWAAIRRQSSDPVDPRAVRLPPYFPDTKIARQDWAQYLDQIEFVDSQVGDIVARLRQEGRYKNATIIFCGDNGRCHLRGKNWLYEPGLKVPLIIKWPQSQRAGEVFPHMISMMDVTATVLDIAGATRPNHLDGNSLRDKTFKRSLIFGARDGAGEVKDHVRSVCNGRWKYIHNYMPDNGYRESKYTREHRPMLAEMLRLKAAGKLTAAQMLIVADKKPVEELYDLQNDPHEIHNLANNPARAELKKQLAAELAAWIKSTNDTGLRELSATN